MRRAHEKGLCSHGHGVHVYLTGEEMDSCAVHSTYMYAGGIRNLILSGSSFVVVLPFLSLWSWMFYKVRIIGAQRDDPPSSVHTYCSRERWWAGEGRG
jgi:hypothetical protein